MGVVNWRGGKGSIASLTEIDTPEIRKYKKRYSSDILWAALRGRFYLSIKNAYVNVTLLRLTDESICF